jgi:hypothetical protein
MPCLRCVMAEEQNVTEPTPTRAIQEIGQGEEMGTPSYRQQLLTGHIALDSAASTWAGPEKVLEVLECGCSASPWCEKVEGRYPT